MTNVKPKCQFVKGKDKINIYPAMNGYDIVRGNPMNSLEDPGVMARIFYHDCKFGYFDFISNVYEDLQCDSDFSMKSISTMDEYEQERTGSNSFSIKARISGEGSGFGISAKASAGYARSTDSDEQAAKKVLDKNKGEIIRAKATCLTHTVTLSEFIRPVFTPDFIAGMKLLHDKVDSTTEEQEKAVATFIRQFGTHYSTHTHLGAELIYERRFQHKAKERSDKLSRKDCVKQEADYSVSASYKGAVSASVSAEVEAKTKKCNSVNKDSAFAEDEGFEATKTISRGSRPKDLKSWIDATFTPVPIKRTLEKINELFRDDWLTANIDYGIYQNLEGAKMKIMFENATKRYCNIMLPGQLNDDCEFVGKT